MTNDHAGGHWSFFCVMKALRRFIPDLFAAGILLLLPLVMFWPVTCGDRTLIPADNLFQWAPWKSYAEEYGVETPHNELLSDLLLENYAWKRFILQSLRERQIPLWSPYLFAGAPFLASGQHSALYPFGLIYLMLPLERAYGVFTVSQLLLAGIFAYLFARVLGIKRPGSLLAAITFQLCGYVLVSVDFPMMLAGSAWLPFLLTMIELVIRQQPAPGGRPATVPWVVLGAAGLGMQLLAGHGENTYLTLFVMGLYAAWRLGAETTRRRTGGDSDRPLPRTHPSRALLRPALWLTVMVLLGIGLGSVQFIPFIELVQHNFREGAVSLEEVLSWAYPWRRLIAFLAPNFFGNPSHHSYFDLFSWRTEAVTANVYGDPIFKIDWGIKNYVEGGAYLGILPLLLAAIAVLGSLQRRGRRSRTSVWFFALLALASLSFIFPTGAYAIIHSIPVINQSHSPFRWVFPLSLSAAVLAGWGFEELAAAESSSRKVRWLSLLALVGGLAGMVGLGVSRVLFDRLEPLLETVFRGLARAPGAFSDVRAFYSYEFRQLTVTALMLLAAGLVLCLARRAVVVRGRPLWQPLALGLVAVDLALATWAFHPAADPALLEVKPELIQFLESQPGHWRLTTFNPHGDNPLHANTPWLYDLQDVRGYDSIITRRYVDYMRAIEPQGELLHNRVQPITNWQSLNSPLLDLLNTKYVITSERLALPKLALVWEGEGLRVYENLAVAPRAFTLPQSSTVIASDPLAAMKEYDPRNYVVRDLERGDPGLPDTPHPGSLTPATIAQYGSQEVLVDAHSDEPSWLILTDSYFPGWKAFVRPLGGKEADEKDAEIFPVDGNFRGVRLDPGAWTVRFKYSPMSFKVGLFGSFMAAVAMVFLGAVWLWRYAYRESAADSTVRRVAKNSLAPMALSLFNRGIDFAFAMLMLRILGAENTGKYYVAIVIAGWFEILANFGLNTLLTREVSKEGGTANLYLVNTTVLRLLTSLVAAVPIALYLLTLGASADPLARETTLALWLLIIGMIPAGANTGLTALFYAYEQAEVPAAVSTVATILKVTLGTLVLLLGMSFVGLAGASIVVNLTTMLLLGAMAFRTYFVPRWELDWKLQWDMVTESFPLMLNHLLATLFFKVDVLLLERLGGSSGVSSDTVVGWYRTGYMWIDALNLLPSLFTFAAFPVLSRQAEDHRETMAETYRLAVKLLVIIALPLAVVTTGVAHFLIRVLGGAEYLPHGAVALQIMVWSIPVGWINSITNYVLIALGRQRLLTRAFVIGFGFNLVANLLLVPRYGYPATAAIAIISEIALLIAFYVCLRPALGPVPWAGMLWRPVVAAAIMAAVTWAGWRLHWALGLAAGGGVYIAALALLGVLTSAERQVLTGLLPDRFRRDAGAQPVSEKEAGRLV